MIWRYYIRFFFIMFIDVRKPLATQRRNNRSDKFKKLGYLAMRACAIYKKAQIPCVINQASSSYIRYYRTRRDYELASSNRV